MVTLHLLHGIDPSTIIKLQGQGIDSTEKLLAAGSTAFERQQLAQKLMVDYELLRTWVKIADLARIETLGKEYIELMMCCGIESVDHLASMQAQQLHDLLATANRREMLVRALPSLSLLAIWIDKAGQLTNSHQQVDLNSIVTAS